MSARIILLCHTCRAYLDTKVSWLPQWDANRIGPAVQASAFWNLGAAALDDDELSAWMDPHRIGRHDAEAASDLDQTRSGADYNWDERAFTQPEIL